MARPQYTIKIYNISDVLTYTVTSDAYYFRTHMAVNDDAGSFEIHLPSCGTGTTDYPLLTVGDQVKIWLGWTSAHSTGDPDFMGSVYQVIRSMQNGNYTTIIKGKSNSEILQRRIKTRTVWVATEADDIIATIASDLSLGDTLITTDTTAVTLTADLETYMDIMKAVSDYYYDAGTQIKKDYYVDVNKNLVWTARPARTTNVETLTVGADSILSYVVTKDRVNIKNAFAVYGAATPFNPTDVSVFGRKYPSDGDEWTYSDVWTATTGTVASGSSTPKVGSSYTHLANTVSPYNITAYATFPVTVHNEGTAGYGAIEFYARRHNTGAGYIQLFAPDSSNYYYMTGISYSDSNDVWKFHRYSIGKNNEYDADKNATGWQIVGSPSWDQMALFGIFCDTVSSDGTIDIDGLCFNFGRWRYAPLSDATSITGYTEHDHTFIDETLTSDTMCEARARTLLYQHKDPVTRIDLTVCGNTNILLGDQLSITLLMEGITATNYYVTAVEHVFSKPDEGWKTIVTLLDTVSSRNIPSIRENETLALAVKHVQQINRNKKRIN